MFDFGFWELGLIVVVALIVVVPERLPGLARDAGLWAGRIKGFISNAKRELRKEIRASEFQQMLDKQQKEIHELKGMLKETESEVKEELEETDQLVKSLEKQIEASNEVLKEAPPTPPPPYVERMTSEHDKSQKSG